MGGETLEGSAYPVEKEKELMNHISIGDREGSKRVLNEIMAHIYIGYGMKYDLLKSRVLELVVLLSRAALEGGAQAEEIFGLNYSYLNEINDYKTVDQLSAWLAKICDRFILSIFRFGEAKHQDAVFKAMAYIQHNYMNKITLEDVAAKVFFSESYFSNIFKKETGISFNKYLNKVRIAASKQLLKEKDLSLADISESVGFHDQSHFSKMFKLITKVSPKKYRESL
jgi:two-component system, response regulator YesN